MELVAEAEEEAGDGSEVEVAAGEVAEGAEVDGSEDEEGKRHAEEIEEEWGDVGESGFYEGEGGSPDERDCDEQEVGGEDGTMGFLGHGSCLSFCFCRGVRPGEESIPQSLKPAFLRGYETQG